MTAEATTAFKTYQKTLDARIKAIEMRNGPAKPGDDILLSVITDGRHAAIDLRLVDPEIDNEVENKLNALVANTYRIWQATSAAEYRRKDGKPSERSGAGQLIFSDLGTISVEASAAFRPSLDPRRADPNGRAGLRDRLHAGLQEVRSQAAALQ
ncbi:hypothetical protein AJ87_08990 [Rhizobium yanglingense]|nr:hypothetical protein AJ87_08990 [Rhizobium yanglingense]